MHRNGQPHLSMTFFFHVRSIFVALAFLYVHAHNRVLLLKVFYGNAHLEDEQTIVIGFKRDIST
jgi:hypothetical protein